MQAPLIIISGPSGVGKTTLVNHLLKKIDSLTRVITVTTRAPRPNEKQGIDYFFISPDGFTELEQAQAFLETNCFTSGAYATPRSLLTFLKQGKTRIILPDINGARKLIALVPRTISFWLEVPEEILRERLAHRGTETTAEQERRIEQAKKEITQAHSERLYTHYIDLSDFTPAATHVESLIYAALYADSSSSSGSAGVLPISRKIS